MTALEKTAWPDWNDGQESARLPLHLKDLFKGL